MNNVRLPANPRQIERVNVHERGSIQTKGTSNVYIKTYIHCLRRKKHNVDDIIFPKKMEKRNVKIKKKKRNREKKFLIADSNFLYQLCTCVYYSYIDSMMLFCGALHVSIGLCMSYRAS